MADSSGGQLKKEDALAVLVRARQQRSVCLSFYRVSILSPNAILRGMFIFNYFFTNARAGFLLQSSPEKTPEKKPSKASTAQRKVNAV